MERDVVEFCGRAERLLANVYWDLRERVCPDPLEADKLIFVLLRAAMLELEDMQSRVASGENL